MVPSNLSGLDSNSITLAERLLPFSSSCFLSAGEREKYATSDPETIAEQNTMSRTVTSPTKIPAVNGRNVTFNKEMKTRDTKFSGSKMFNLV